MAETKQDVFDQLLKKYQSAANMREWNNTARGNTYLEAKRALDQEIQGWKKRYQNATTS